MPRHSTPVTVRCARWAAIAAAITAFGSIFNTMWSERPWWETEPVPMVSAAPAPTADEPRLLMSSFSPEATTETSFSWSKWALIGSVVILTAAAGAEGIHRWRNNR